MNPDADPSRPPRSPRSQSYRSTSPPLPPPVPQLHLDPTPTPIEFLQHQIDGCIYRPLAGFEVARDGSIPEPPISPVRLEGSPLAPHNPRLLQAPAIPQLEINLQALALSDRRQEGSSQSNSRFGLYIKIASTGGQVRVPSLSILQQALRRAWRACYQDVIQVNRYVFKALFNSYRDMMWVFKKQPWIVQSETLLLELAAEENEDFEQVQNQSIQNTGRPRYQFKHIYVMVRVYGLEGDNRLLVILVDILKSVGVPSEFHEPSEAMIKGHADYMWGIIRHTVCNPVRDRINLCLGSDRQVMVYLHYEKIGRICLFCGVMFHTSGNCQLRQSIITNRMRAGQQPEEVPFQRYGPWLIATEKLPQPPLVNPVFSNFQTTQLSRFNNIFATEKGRNLSIAEGDTIDRLKNLEKAMKSPQLEVGQSSTEASKLQELHDDTVPAAHPSPRAVQGLGDDSPRRSRHESHVAPTEPAAIDGLHPVALMAIQPVNSPDREAVSRQNDEMDVQPNVQKEQAANTPFLSQLPDIGPGAKQRNSNLSSQQFFNSVSPPAAHYSLKCQASDHHLIHLPSKKRSGADPSSHGAQVAGQEGNIIAANAGLTGDFQTRSCKDQVGTSVNDGARRDGGNLATKSYSAAGGGILGASPAILPQRHSSESQLQGGIQHQHQQNWISGAAPEARPRIRRSRWEPAPPPLSRGNHGSPMGTTIYRPGAAIWCRVPAAGSVGGGGSCSNSSSPAMGQLCSSYYPTSSRAHADSFSSSAPDHDPYPLRTPSLSSVGTVDSRAGAFSTPRMVGALYMARHGGAGSSGASEMGNDQSQAQLATSDGTTVLDGKKNLDSGIGSLMDGKATAPASKAPREP